MNSSPLAQPRFLGLKLSSTVKGMSMACLLGFTLSLSAAPRSEQEPAPGKDSAPSVCHSEELTRQLLLIIKQNPLPFSGVIELRQGKKILLSHAAGESQGKPITSDSQFVLGSLSKQVFAVLVMRAIERGDFKLNDSAAALLGKEAELDPAITVAMLLSHTSGISIQGQALLFTPGSDFKYSNDNYWLLAEILKREGSSSTQLLQRFFDAEGLELKARTGSIESIQEQLPNLAIGRAETDSGFESVAEQLTLTDKLLASGALIGSASAFADFQQALHQGQLLSRGGYLQLLAPRGKRPHRWGELNYAAGIQLSPELPLEFSHSGYIAGYISTAIYYPDSGFNLVVLENTSWSLKDIGRVFALHDKLRQAVRETAANCPLEKAANLPGF
ncbi:MULTISPECIES: serine hydrolase domain-containing protein [Shewanella]|uniref:serine hydrolase domain-containing protein n=1 Tax=Shewanella TaxID=22 RepID=UPI000D6492E1|nr:MULTISPECIES: serine hydrolase domain-containing protein [Shewanella]MBC8797843.1 beta-lactamase family protein [Shewanella algae]MBO2693313.1 beta-lactamase family protein [Shewanella algae]MDC8853647.1 serine hydrolase [Shewanella algae]MDV2963209.1 serine hydrolase domain-containing protein [Shewanella algae]NJI86589.1 beta-lactamase family protein [Shewanella sp. Iso12]